MLTRSITQGIAVLLSFSSCSLLNPFGRTPAPHHRGSEPVTQPGVMAPIQPNPEQLSAPHVQPVSVDYYGRMPHGTGHIYPPVGQSTPTDSYPQFPHGPYIPDHHGRTTASPMEATSSGTETTGFHTGNNHHPGTPQRRPTPRRNNRDDRDGPYQILPQPTSQTATKTWGETDLPQLPTNLEVDEQDQILSAVNDRLSQCAFDFFAKYRFRIPRERDKREVQRPSDREWTEWVYLLKGLATKRRIPQRVLYDGQIKQLVTVLENSLEMRHAAKHTSRPVKDDRNVLQLISAGTQVAKMLKDRDAMVFLDWLYGETESNVYERKRVYAYR